MIKEISAKVLKWRYSDNIDQHRNNNYKNFSNMCELLKILPLNHCLYKKNEFEGNWTYFKANRKSQIDLVLTNSKGCMMISVFNIIKSGWHFSDYLPIEIEIIVPSLINATTILLRARSLNEDCNKLTVKPIVKNYKNKFDEVEGEKFLLENTNVILLECENQSADRMVDNL